MSSLNKFFHVGEVVYGKTFTTSIDFDKKIEMCKFDCPCVQFTVAENIIIATFVGNEKPKGSKPYHKIIELEVEFEDGETTFIDLQLLIINDYDTTRKS